MKHTPLMLLAGIALMACSPSEPTTTAATEMPAAPASAPAEPAPPPAAMPTDPAADTCNMAQYAALVGKPGTDPSMPPASANVRITKPGDQVTMDFVPARLNVDLDAMGNVVKLRCG